MARPHCHNPTIIIIIKYGRACVQAAARDAFVAWTGNHSVDVWLLAGDNAYDNSLQSDYDNHLFGMYGGVMQSSVMWPSFGNHEALSARSSGRDCLGIPE